VSVMFEAMLLPSLNEAGAVRELNRLLHIADSARHQQFGEIDMRFAGGTKFFTRPVYAACFNHLTPGEVEECICAAPWRYPEHVLYLRDLGDYSWDDDPLGWTAQSVAELAASRGEGEQ
jgi:hypothetical protein